MTDDYISPSNTLERLVRLETKIHLKFEALDKALLIAEKQLKEERIYTRDQIAEHFKLVNNSQARMDKLVERLAAQKWVLEKLEEIDNRFSDVRRLVYIGVGIAISFGFAMRFLIR
jgi:hypothetical protein